MEKLITEFNQTGICTVDVEKVVKAWTNKFTILRHNPNKINTFENQFTLVKYGRGSNCAKVQISEDQAFEIIEKLKLKRIRDSFFRLASAYRTESFIKEEIIRFCDIMDKYKAGDEKTVKKFPNGILPIVEVVATYNEALI